MSLLKGYATLSRRQSRFSLGNIFALLVFVALVLHSRSAFPAQATLSWDVPSTNVDGTPLTDLAGYKIYCGTASGSYSQVVNVGNVTTSTVSNLNDGATYYLAVTAYDSAGLESGYSNEVSKTSQTVQQYSLSIIRNGTGTGTVTSSPAAVNCGVACIAAYNPGSVVTLTAAPASGSTFGGWSGGGCTGTGTCSLSMNANITVTAVFAGANSFTITATAGSGGAISPSGSVSVSQGANQAYTITPNTGYTVSDVKVDGTSVGAVSSYAFSNVGASHTIAVTFAANTYTVTPSAGANGSISPSTVQIVNCNAPASFTVTPTSGYHIVTVTGCGGTLSGSTYTTGPATANCTVTATFGINSYTITASAGVGGSISPSGSVAVSSGTSKAFTITPNSGYTVSDVQVDGTSVGAVSSYAFSNVGANHTIAATFAASTVVTAPTTITFDSPAPSGSSGSYLNGIFQGINFGTKQWRWENAWLADSTKHIYFASSSGTSRTFSFSPAPRVLISMRVLTGKNGTLTLTDNLGQTITRTVTTGSMQTVTTGWTQASTTITVQFTAGWELAIDDIAFRAP